MQLSRLDSATTEEVRAAVHAWQTAVFTVRALICTDLLLDWQVPIRDFMVSGFPGLYGVCARVAAAGRARLLVGLWLVGADEHADLAVVEPARALRDHVSSRS